VDQRTYPLTRPFLVLATQNPIEHHGTYPLPESQLDRFLMRIKIGYPAAAAEKEIFRTQSRTHPLEQLRPVMEGAAVVAIQEEVKSVHVEDALVDYALAIVEKTRESELLTLGVSPRGFLALLRAAQALAYLEGREYCIPDDVKQLVPCVLSHRILVNNRFSSLLKRNEEAEMILQEILSTVEVPL